MPLEQPETALKTGTSQEDQPFCVHSSCFGLFRAVSSKCFHFAHRLALEGKKKKGSSGCLELFRGCFERVLCILLHLKLGTGSRGGPRGGPPSNGVWHIALLKPYPPYFLAIAAATCSNLQQFQSVFFVDFIAAAMGFFAKNSLLQQIAAAIYCCSNFFFAAAMQIWSFSGHCCSNC